MRERVSDGVSRVERDTKTKNTQRYGQHDEKRSSFGHALIADPWGTVVAECTEAVCMITCWCLGLLPRVRHRRRRSGSGGCPSIPPRAPFSLWRCPPPPRPPLWTMCSTLALHRSRRPPCGLAALCACEWTRFCSDVCGGTSHSVERPHFAKLFRGTWRTWYAPVVDREQRKHWRTCDEYACVQYCRRTDWAWWSSTRRGRRTSARTCPFVATTGYFSPLLVLLPQHHHLQQQQQQQQHHHHN